MSIRLGAVERGSPSSPFSQCTLLLHVQNRWTPQAWCRPVPSVTMTCMLSGLSMRARAWVSPIILSPVYPVAHPSCPAPLGPGSTAVRTLCVFFAGRSSAGKVDCVVLLWPGYLCFYTHPAAHACSWWMMGRSLLLARVWNVRPWCRWDRAFSRTRIGLDTEPQAVRGKKQNHALHSLDTR